MSDASASKRARVEQNVRDTAVGRIISIVAQRLPSEVIDAAKDEPGGLNANSPTIVDAVARRSTATLKKRASSLSIYDAWLTRWASADTRLSDEPTLHRYMRSLLADKAPASRGAAVLSALHFVGVVFGGGMEQVWRSARVSGASLRLQATRGEVVQRAPLTVKMVATLEAVVLEDEGRGNYDAVIAGAALFTLFSRSRVGDLRRCAVEPILDGEFLETRFLDHKTARPGSRRALPIVAPVCGVTRDWGTSWIRTRQAAGLDAKVNTTIIPVGADTGGWHAVPMTTEEFAIAFRNVLVRHGVTSDELSNVGSHSLKVTCLSWAGKFGLARDVRRLLGYHADPADQSMETYSRDVMAKPLRQLVAVILEVREGRFNPDASRSGTFVGGDPPLPHNEREADLPLAASSSSGARARPPSPSSPPRSPRAASLSPSSCSSSSVLDLDGPEAAGSELAMPGSFVRNSASGVHHVAASAAHLMCGKPLPVNFSIVDSVEPDAKRCRLCF